MLISNFNTVVDVYKKLKAPLVTIDNQSPNVIIGAYDDFNVLRLMKLQGEAPFLKPGMWLNLGISSDIDLTGTVPSELIEMINGSVMRNSDGQELFFIDVNRELNKKLRKLEAQIYFTGEYIKKFEGVFNQGEFFEKFNSQKASDGASILRIAPGICPIIYKGLIPYNKADTVLYNIYCGKDNFIVEFITKKKKATEPDLYTYIRYLYV